MMTSKSDILTVWSLVSIVWKSLIGKVCLSFQRALRHRQAWYLPLKTAFGIEFKNICTLLRINLTKDKSNDIDVPASTNLAFEIELFWYTYIMKKIIVILILSLNIFGYCNAKDIRIAARVNDEIITNIDLENFIIMSNNLILLFYFDKYL